MKKHKCCGSTNKLIIISGEYSLDDLLPYIYSHDKIAFSVKGCIYQVKTGSARYRVFSNSTECVICGLNGDTLLLEKHRKTHQSSAHFNLYGVEDEQLVLMTKDHIVPKSKGGADRDSNYQTMCSICNTAKKNNADMSVEDILAKRREIIQGYGYLDNVGLNNVMFSLIPIDEEADSMVEELVKDVGKVEKRKVEKFLNEMVDSIDLKEELLLFAKDVLGIPPEQKPSPKAQEMLERGTKAARKEVKAHLEAGREVHGMRDGKPVVIKPKK